MSSEKNSEVVGCDASIMKNVWEIREREYGQKMQLEQERIEKSALPSINQDWANRMVAKMGNYKRVERKTKPDVTQIDYNNVWKSKQSQVAPSPPGGASSGPLGRPGGMSRGPSTQVPNYKNKEGQNENFKKLQLVMYITQTHPSAMMWGKSWQYNKSLPAPAEGIKARSDWGSCWMLATHQPYYEEGTSWPNGPNMVDPHSLHLWKKPDYRGMESKELDFSHSIEEWQMSWRISDINNEKEDTSFVKGENVYRSGYFTFLLETQQHNKALSSSEWSESWRSTKPESPQEHFTVPNDGVMNEYIANKQDKKSELSSGWEECWRLVNHHRRNKSQVPQVQKSHSPEWANSWKAAMEFSSNHKNSYPSLRQDHSDTYDDCIQQKEASLQKIILASNKQYRDLYLQHCNEFKDLSEWSRSWQVTINNSKPCKEIERVLRALSLKTDLEAQEREEENPKAHDTRSEKADLHYEQLKHNVIYWSRREFTKSKLLLQKPVENVLFSAEWRDSWKTLKHRMRIERRRMRPDPLRPFRESEKGGDMKITASEWKDSWKYTCQPLHQEPELWKQGWPTTPQIRFDRSRDRNNFVLMELLQNGPIVEHSWGESWRFSRRQHRSEPVQGNVQDSQGRAGVACYNPDDSWVQKRYVRSVSDWQTAWRVSENQYHHDKPSQTQWREAWKWSVFHTEHRTEQVPRENLLDEDMEIQPLKEKTSLQRAKAKMSWSFDSQIFRERYLEKEWSASWRVGLLLNHQLSHYESSAIPGKSIKNTIQQQHVTFSELGSKWGMSFRLANPMPHVEKPWMESSPNPCHYSIISSRGKNIQNKINTNFNNNPELSRLWGTSHQFLQGANIQTSDKSKIKESIDPWEIITKKTKTRKHLYSKILKEKQSERKWAGCHLLGKTQPNPKRSPASENKHKMQDENEDKNFEGWAESWMFRVQPDSLKKQMPMKSLIGWTESWKFLLPRYMPKNVPKAK